MSTGSPTSLESTRHRLTHVISHLRTTKMKVVVCRDLGPDVMPLLRERPELDVRLIMPRISWYILNRAVAAYRLAGR
jgi:hypothetical protein